MRQGSPTVGRKRLNGVHLCNRSVASHGSSMAGAAQPHTVISASSSCQSAFLNSSIQRTPRNRRLIEDETSIEILKAFGNTGRTLKKNPKDANTACAKKSLSDQTGVCL